MSHDQRYQQVQRPQQSPTPTDPKNAAAFLLEALKNSVIAGLPTEVNLNNASEALNKLGIRHNLLNGSQEGWLVPPIGIANDALTPEELAKIDKHMKAQACLIHIEILLLRVRDHRTSSPVKKMPSADLLNEHYKIAALKRKFPKRENTHSSKGTIMVPDFANNVWKEVPLGDAQPGGPFFDPENCGETFDQSKADNMLQKAHRNLTRKIINKYYDDEVKRPPFYDPATTGRHQLFPKRPKKGLWSGCAWVPMCKERYISLSDGFKPKREGWFPVKLEDIPEYVKSGNPPYDSDSEDKDASKPNPQAKKRKIITPKQSLIKKAFPRGTPHF